MCYKKTHTKKWIKQTTKKNPFEKVHFKNTDESVFDDTSTELLDDTFQKLDQAF